ncbi:MAG: transcriptional regulator, partial [Mesorhizobium sp.]
MAEPLIVRREVQIAAPPATVFAFLTDPDKIVRWMGTEATAEPNPGGLYLLNLGGRVTARGQFTEVIPVHRLAYSFGWEGNDRTPPGSSLVEIDLVEE